MYKMLIFYCFILISIVTNFSSPLYSQSNPRVAAHKSTFDLQKFIPSFEEEIKKSLEIWGAPAVAVVVVVDGQVVYEKGFGVTSVEDPEDVNEHTIFPIASLSKPFVATLAMQLEGAGKISTNDSVQKWFPEIQLGSYQQGQGMIIKDLMTHNSGLPPFSGDTFNWMGAGAQETINVLKQIRHQHPSRQKFGYQNVLFGVLGLYMEKATQQTLPALMHEYIITPLQLVDTFIGGDIMQSQPWWNRMWQKLTGKYRSVAQPHDVWAGKVHQLAYSPLFYTFLGSTGVNTSAHDLGKWMVVWVGQNDKNPAWPIHNFQQMIKPQAYEDREDDIFFCHQRMKKVAYGMGWYSHTYGDEPVITHQGGLRGIRSVMTFSMDKRVGIAVISNLGGMRISALPEALRDVFWDAYLGLPYVDWSKQLKEKMDKRQSEWKTKRMQMYMRIPAPSQPLNYYVGAYEHDVYGRMDIKESVGQKLVMEYRGRTIPLKHINGNVYQFEAKDLSDFFAEPENPGTIEFGGGRMEKADLCDVQLLHEGKDPFHRVEK